MDVVEIRKVLARGLLMRGQVVVAPGSDALQLRPTERKLVLDVKRAPSIMRELFFSMGTQAQVLALDTERQIPIQPLLLPVIEPLHFVSRGHEEFKFHLFELPQAKNGITRRDLVAERLADLRN